MEMRKKLGVLFLAFSLCRCFHLAAADTTNVVPTTVLVEFDGGKVKYKVGPQTVRAADILEAMGRVKKQRGPTAPVLILIDERNSLAALSNVRGIVNKAGLSSVRYFYFTADREMMEEILFDQLRAQRFSVNPPSGPP